MRWIETRGSRWVEVTGADKKSKHLPVWINLDRVQTLARGLDDSVTRITFVDEPDFTDAIDVVETPEEILGLPPGG